MKIFVNKFKGKLWVHKYMYIYAYIDIYTYRRAIGIYIYPKELQIAAYGQFVLVYVPIHNYCFPSISYYVSKEYSAPFYIVTYYMKWVTTSWAHSNNCPKF